jgi:hypothetical protein
MAFTIPNRPDTTDADQAEPDKGDFQSLGYQKSGVLSGGVVTNTATNTVTASAVSGYLNGEYFNITADTVISMSAPATGNAKFVLINVQKSGGVFSVYAIQGTTANNGMSTSNARFPDFDSTTDMLLAAVYYASGDTDINAAALVDKRVFVLPQANPTVVTSTPGSAVGTIGEIRIDSNLTPATGQTRIYVKTDATTWTNLGTPQTGVSSEEVQDIVGAMFTTDASHTGISAIYDDSGGGIDLTGASSWNLTVAGSTENVTDSETVTINVSSDAEVSLSHSNGTITINDEWPKVRTFTHPGSGATKPAHYLYSDPWGYGGPNPPVYPAAGRWDDQYLYSSLIMASHWPNTNNAWTSGSYSYRWSGVYGVTVYYQSLSGLSDRALKQDFGEVPGIDFVNRLQPQSYTFKDNPGSVRWGIVAQDVEALCTEQGITNSVVTMGEDGLRNLNYVDLIAPVIKSIQDLVVQVDGSKLQSQSAVDYCADFDAKMLAKAPDAEARDTNIADLQARVAALESA